MGPIGLLLESIHLQPASLDPSWKIVKYNQQPIDLIEGSAHLVSPLITRFAARNRTRRAEGLRDETVGLFEIDTYATHAKHEDEVPEEKRIVLRLMQSGSNWTKSVTAKTGRTDEEVADVNCDLCGLKETSDHIWHCTALKCKARQLDVDLATADPYDFTPAMRQGIACALNADPTRTYWGEAPEEDWGANRTKLYDCCKEEDLPEEVQHTVSLLRGEAGGMNNLTAREWMETLTARGKGDTMPSVKAPVDGEAPADPNAFSDGSLKHTKGLFWGVGGAGVWWPDRSAATLGEEEKRFTEYEELLKTSGQLTGSGLQTVAAR